VSSLYKAILPDKDAGAYVSHVHLFREVVAEIYKAMQGASINQVLDEARELIETSMYLNSYIRETPDDAYLPEGHFDLSKIDYDELAQSMKQDHPNIKAEQLRSQLTQRLEQMVRQNPTRVDYQEKLKQIVYKNSDNSANNAIYPQELVDFARQLHEEELRAKREGLSEEGLAIFDLLIRIDQPLSLEDREQVKTLTKELLDSLKREDIGIEWQKKQQTSGAIDDSIKKILGKLPAIYDEATYNQKCVDVFHYTLTHFQGPGAA
ncbi:MAG: DUF3387 domain-containing protein, partial [Ktedonobacteraceae bacterium]|nr:DUF3387 domain-containing protein [Ktedonobacteraceae bacterium]